MKGAILCLVVASAASAAPKPVVQEPRALVAFEVVTTNPLGGPPLMFNAVSVEIEGASLHVRRADGMSLVLPAASTWAFPPGTLQRGAAAAAPPAPKPPDAAPPPAAAPPVGGAP